MDGRYADRAEAGRALAERLKPLAGKPDLVVLALPRGGVPVAYVIARRLGAPLDVFVVRKLGVPGHEELAMGALASTGAMVLNQALIDRLRGPFTYHNDRTDFAGNTQQVQRHVAAGCDFTWASFDAGPGSTFRAPES